jgi:hypothetical protein
VNVVVAYGRDFSEEGWANVQSASAAIENMSLAAHVLGLGTFWITQMGDREQRARDRRAARGRLVVAVLALGYPSSAREGPEAPADGARRRTATTTRGGRSPRRRIPTTGRADLLAVYQRARVLNGLRHNKPRAWEVARSRRRWTTFVPEGRTCRDGGARRSVARRAPLHGHRHGDAALRPAGIPASTSSSGTSDGRRVRRGADVAARGDVRLARDGGRGLGAPSGRGYDVVSCFYPLENLRRRSAPSCSRRSRAG